MTHTHVDKYASEAAERAAEQATLMRRREEEAYLRARGWQVAGESGNKWRSRTGMLCSFATALGLEAIRDKEKGKTTDD